MKKYHLIITFFISLLLHSLLLFFLFQSNHLKGFKKGIGEDRKIKISSFEIASFDAEAKIPPSNPSSQKKPPSSKKQNTKNLQENKRSFIQNQKSQQEYQNDHNQDKKDALQDSPQEEQNQFNQVLPRVPIEQSLSYQLADAQTKQDISKFYGAEFGQLGLEEQEYILNNLAYIGRITQRYLRYPPNAGMLAQSGGNVIEFYLHPNGDISDLKIIKQSGFILLDRNSIKTIEIAYKDYPHPKTKTLIRFYINYYLR